MQHPTHPDAAMILLSLPQFRGVFSSLFDEKLKTLMDALQQGRLSGEPEYLTTQQALDFLHLSKPTLNKLRREGLITAYSSSDKRKLYRRADLVAYLKASTRKGGKASW